MEDFNSNHLIVPKQFRYHLNRFNWLITQLNNLDEKFKNKGKAILLLVSLPKKYNNVITSLLVRKTELALDATIVCLLEVKRLMMQELGDAYDRALILAKAYNNKKKLRWQKSFQGKVIARKLAIFNRLFQKQRRTWRIRRS